MTFMVWSQFIINQSLAEVSCIHELQDMAEEVLVVCTSSSDEAVDDMVNLTKSRDSGCESECDFEIREGKK